MPSRCARRTLSGLAWEATIVAAACSGFLRRIAWSWSCLLLCPRLFGFCSGLDMGFLFSLSLIVPRSSSGYVLIGILLWFASNKMPWKIFSFEFEEACISLEGIILAFKSSKSSWFLIPQAFKILKNLDFYVFCISNLTLWQCHRRQDLQFLSIHPSSISQRAGTLAGLWGALLHRWPGQYLSSMSG